MLIWLILEIFLIIAAVCLIIVLIHTFEEKITIIISYFVFIFGCFIIIEYINSKPKAIDVYKGKTELRITYEGNTPVDSAVVFKK